MDLKELKCEALNTMTHLCKRKMENWELLQIIAEEFRFPFSIFCLWKGGISNGEPIVFKVAFKPPATIGKDQVRMHLFLLIGEENSRFQRN